MAGEVKEDKPELTSEEIIILKQVAEGQVAMRWFTKRSKNIAVYISIIIGAYLALTGQISSWLQSLLNNGGN